MLRKSSSVNHFFFYIKDKLKIFKKRMVNRKRKRKRLPRHRKRTKMKNRKGKKFISYLQNQIFQLFNYPKL